jgi:hypothetical protein
MNAEKKLDVDPYNDRSITDFVGQDEIKYEHLKSNP